MKLTRSVSRLRRQAKTMSRDNAVPLHVALDTIAQQNGFARWSLLIAQNPQLTPPEQFFALMSPGDLTLIAARRNQGKTRFALDLARLAARAGLWTKIYSFEYTDAELRNHLTTEDADDAIALNCSDEVSAQTIADDLAQAGRPSFILIDYMQALDHQRSKPDLGTQLEILKTAAQDHSAIICLISQIDRAFDDNDKRFPDIDDLRLPNPIAPHLFSVGAFLNKGSITFQTVQP
ncbi:DNA helicase [Devosia sp. MC1541]|uniref:DNA helicase n=1 Tax=Devosia sp. MC1541 TaxID=2725264 RepID=UPI00145CD7A8|nr:DNA helicase [Devosia sp. MC1541]